MILPGLLATALMSVSASAAVSLDGSGWTVVTPSADSRIVYVSDSDGNDSNDGLSPSTPKKTIVSGNALIRDGYPDHLLLKRGDVFDQRGMNNTLTGGWKNGRSAQEPVVMSYYGASGPRPQILVERRLVDHNGNNRDYQAYIGLEVYRIGSDPDSLDFDNEETAEIIRLVGGGRDILIEDCHLRFGQVTVQNFSSNFYYDIRLRRNIIVDAWRHGTSIGRAERSGLFMSGVRGSYLIEENFFDHNGWNATIANAGANQFNHNVYIQYTNVAGGIMRGNISARGSAHGWHGRSGGVLERNLFAENAVSANLGGQSSPTDPDVMTFNNRFVENVIINGRRMDPHNPDWPLSTAVWGFIGAFIGEIDVVDNIIANRRDSGNNKGFGTDQQPSSLNLVSNIVYNWDSSQDIFNPSWPNPDADLGDYMASLGYANSVDAFYEWQRNRPVREMPWEMTAYAAINYIREGFNKDPVAGYYNYGTENETEDTWAGLTVVNGWTFSGDQLGWLYVGLSPWVYSDVLTNWLFLPESHYTSEGAWCYLPKF